MKKSLSTDRLLLRPYVAGDAAVVFNLYAHDSEVTRYLTWRPHGDLDQTKAFIESRILAWERGKDLTWAVTLKDGELVGGIGLRVEGFKANCGYVIGRPHWGNGYATEAVRAVVHLAATNTNIYRIWAVCDIDNAASARVLEKAGLEFEGILRGWIMHPQVASEPKDCRCYATINHNYAQQGNAPDALTRAGDL